MDVHFRSQFFFLKIFFFCTHKIFGIKIKYFSDDEKISLKYRERSLKKSERSLKKYERSLKKSERSLKKHDTPLKKHDTST